MAKRKVFDFISDLALLEMSDEVYPVYATKRQACETLRDYFLKEHNRELTVQQIYDKISILRKRRQEKLDKIEKTFLKEETIATPSALECSPAKESGKEATKIFNVAIWSTVFKDKNNQSINLNNELYKMIDMEKVVAFIDNQVQSQNITKTKAIEHLANTFCIDKDTLASRYYSIRKAMIKKSNEPIQDPVLLQAKIKGLQSDKERLISQLETLEKSHHQEREFHLHFKEISDRLRQDNRELVSQISKYNRPSLLCKIADIITKPFKR